MGMGKIGDAIAEIHEIDEMAEKKTKIHQLHPLVKLVVTIVYITCVVSFDKYNLIGLLPMIIYPLMVLNLAELELKKCLKKLRIALPLVCFVGILNPLYDHSPVYVGDFIVLSGGIVSMLTLMLKGVYALMASFLLIASTGIEGIGYALRILRVPKMIVTQILLAYRYITILLNEANTIFEAYSLRAPNEKGVKYKIWGPLIGQLLLRSIDRATNLYESMLLRGFQGDYYFTNYQKCKRIDYIYLILSLLIMLTLRLYHVAGVILHTIQFN
jgi:cobalt/nickel transport system permease protein